MSFKASASADIPVITWGDLHGLNTLVRPDPGSMAGRGPLNALKLRHRRWMERRIMQHVSASEYVVLAAISSRTFSWQKVIEVIPLDTFVDGVINPRDSAHWAEDNDGEAVFAGTGLGKSTVRRSIATLVERRLIERFQVPGPERNLHAYMPVSARTLYYALAASEAEDVEVSSIPEGIMRVLEDPDARPIQGSLEHEFLAPWMERVEQSAGRSHAA